MTLDKYSIGVGDRFGHQGAAQLCALKRAKEQGVTVVPVWNKSNREHMIIGTRPSDTRHAADEAVRVTGWKDSYFVDADHIGLKTVEPFLAWSNFFTLDVADFIGMEADRNAVESFVRSMEPIGGSVHISGIPTPLAITDADLYAFARKYLLAVKEAGKIYRYVSNAKPSQDFVIEISTDEASQPQTPMELYLILAAIAEEKIPIQTIAPKFTGKFLKGVDYVGVVVQFAKEFEEDLHVITHAVNAFGLPRNLKLSVHSGSDKFSLYPFIHRAIKRLGAGLHVKTAGTTWLEELIGIALSGQDGLVLAKAIYQEAYERIDELSKPYESVIAIDRLLLPSPTVVSAWNGEQYAAALRHDQSNRSFNPHLRQLLHVGYKVAAEMGEKYVGLLEQAADTVGQNVTENLWRRHVSPIFLGES
jgi:tagaturonate epimerase